MRNILFSPVLKRNAKEQLVSNLGTVIGAFLMFGICTIPVKLVFDSFDYPFEWTPIIKLLITYVLSVVAELWVIVLVTGFETLTLKLACRSEAAVSDVFFALKSGIWKKAIAIYALPVVVFQAAFLVVRIFAERYLVVAEPVIGQLDITTVLSYQTPEEMMAFSEKIMPLVSYEFEFLGVGLLALILAVVLRVIMMPALFILLDYPEKSVGEIVKLNFRLIKKRFGKLLYIYLSFIPWYLLSLVTCYISLGFSYPYMQLTLSYAYLELARLEENASGKKGMS